LVIDPFLPYERDNIFRSPIYCYSLDRPSLS